MAFHAFSFVVLFLQLGFEVFQRTGYFLTSSINKASISEYFPMFHEFVDKMDDRAQHGKRYHVTRSKNYNWLNFYVNASEKVERLANTTHVQHA